MRSIGNKGEDIAVKFLKKNGYKIVERNFYSRFGEIDIIATDKETLVFVEVKMRKSTDFGKPEETVIYKKQEKLRITAQHYLMNKVPLPPCRFDIVAIVGETKLLGTKIDEIKLIKNAF